MLNIIYIYNIIIVFPERINFSYRIIFSTTPAPSYASLGDGLDQKRLVRTGEGSVPTITCPSAATSTAAAAGPGLEVTHLSHKYRPAHSLT